MFASRLCCARHRSRLASTRHRFARQDIGMRSDGFGVDRILPLQLGAITDRI